MMRYARAMDSDLLAFIEGSGAGASPRTRAPKRDGHRTQLTVPADQWEETLALADQAGTTPNDMLVRLAHASLAELRRRRDLKAIGESRIAAYHAARSESAGDEWPSYDEYRAAVGRMRADDDS
jgi:hypothetical protein